MKEISFGKSINKSNGVQRAFVEDILNDIKSGKYEQEIKQLRGLTEKKDRDEFKRTHLPYFTSSIFKSGSRKASDFESSEFMILDIDGKQIADSGKDLRYFREILQDSTSIYAMFYSPSGDGLKIIYEFNSPIVDSQHYTTLYSYYGNKFTSDYNVSIDISCKDVSRACFVSDDPDLYVNKNAVPLSTDINIVNQEINFRNYAQNDPGKAYSGEPVTDNYELYLGIVKHLETKKKIRYEEGNKHNYLVAVAGACNRYGVDKEFVITQMIKDYQQREGVDYVLNKDFTIIVERVYKTYEHQHRCSKFFKRSNSESFSEIEIDLEFWFYDDKNKLTFSREKYIKFLELNGFRKMYYGKDYEFIRIINNIIYEVNKNRIQDFVINYLKNLQIVGLNELLLRGCNIYFGEKLLSSIETIQPTIKKDTKQEAFFYFKNRFVVVTKEKIAMYDYSELKEFIWEKQIMQRDFEITNEKSDFERFITNIGRFDEERVESIKSAIGYLLHSHKDSSNAKAIVFCDERIGDGSNGRCGKSLVGKGIGFLKNMASEDGKQFTFKSNFAFQKVSLDTQVIFFNDIRENFDFEKLFATITDNMTIEKKNKDAFIIPFETSPKILITTNFVIKEDDDSTLDRKFEVEFSDHYNINHKPLTEFNKRFFDEWTTSEWNSFYLFMLECVKLYLSKGLLNTKYINLDSKRIEATTCKEFMEFIKDIELNHENNKKSLYNTFKEAYTDYMNLRQNTFTKWLKKYCQYKKLQYRERKSGCDTFFTARQE